MFKEDYANHYCNKSSPVSKDWIDKDTRNLYVTLFDKTMIDIDKMRISTIQWIVALLKRESA